MTIIADTSALLAAFDKDEEQHQKCASIYNKTGGFVYTIPVLTELDHLLRQRIHAAAAEAAAAHIVGRTSGPGAVDHIAVQGSADLLNIAEVRTFWARMEIDFADASVVVAARRFGTNRIFTLDHGDFRKLLPRDGRFNHFHIVPADS